MCCGNLLAGSKTTLLGGLQIGSCRHRLRRARAIFQVFDAMTYATAYVIGAFIILSGADMRLALPLLAWLVLYGLLVRWTVKRVGPGIQGLLRMPEVP